MRQTRHPYKTFRYLCLYRPVGINRGRLTRANMFH